MKELNRFVPWFVAGFGALCLVYMAVPHREPEGERQLYDMGRVAVMNNGRAQSLENYARNILMGISNRQTYRDLDGNSQPAIKWLLEVMTSNPRKFKRFDSPAGQLKVFRIENDQVLLMLGLKELPGNYRYSLAEILPSYERLRERASRANEKDAKKRNLFEMKVLQLWGQLQTYFSIAGWEAPLVLPSANGGSEWLSLEQGVTAAQRGAPPNPAVVAWVKMLVAYNHGTPGDFNNEVAAYREQLDGLLPDESAKARFEAFFNNFAPFYWCSIIYVFVFLLAVIGWLAAPETMYRSAFWLAIVALVVHTWGLLARMYLSGRWGVFVTNLYSSAVFIGWMCVVTGIILEAIYHNGVGGAVAGLTGAASLAIAHHLGSSGDTLEMLQAVLDTNFWLMTHVTTVTIGYAATVVAGFLGVAYIIAGVFIRGVPQELFRALTQMIYGVVCFAMLFSFVGTVLGGIWADQSWGRFWGWDPKENGALLIVLWNALILHARWGGLIKQRGLAVLAVVGNMVTGWSWFGTNQLGVGLHAYGFSNALATGLTIFWGTQLAVILIGSLVPLTHWRAFMPAQPALALTAARRASPSSRSPLAG